MLAWIRELDGVIAGVARAAVLLAGLCGVLTATAGDPPATIRVGSELAFQPYADIDSQGRATGFSVELFAAVANAADLRVEFVPGEWNGVWRGLMTGAVDALPLVARLPAREGLVEFGSPHTIGYDTFFVRKGHKLIDTIEAARDATIIVMRSDAAHDALAARGFKRQLVFAETLAEGFRMLESGTYDALLAPVIQGKMQFQMLGLSQVVEHGALLREYRREFCFATRKGDIALRDKLETGLAIVKASGNYDRLYKKWLGVYEPASIPRTYVYWGAAALLTLLAVILAWSWTLRREVAVRTAELRRHQEDLETIVAERTSELSASEAKFRQAKEAAEAAAHAKGIFLANMSHEIRTPLHVIIGLAHLLSRDERDLVQQTRLRQLTENSEHLLAIINDILDLSKADVGRLEIDCAPFRIDDVVTKVRRMLEVGAQERGLTLTASLVPELRGVAVLGDAQRLTQVLLNLGSNAIKFTERGAVSLAVERLTEDAGRVAVRFIVKDTGIGIAPADQIRLFEPFEQADSSSTRSQRGTGLGLAISQHLVGLMGGAIRLVSQAGAGSRFCFDLVLQRADEEAGTATATDRPAAEHFPGARVLFAEDHAMSQQIVLEMLEDLGCDAEVAASGVEAVQCAKLRHYDVILMDMQMPEMDGLTATREIRALPAYRHTPIIAVTANVFAEDRQRCLDAGMNGHLAKPVTPATLAAAMAQWLPGTAAVTSAPPGDSELCRALTGIDGLEVGSNWKKSDAHLDDYCARLLAFVEACAADLEEMRGHLAAMDHDAARARAHQLKGIAGLLGATRAHEIAARLDRSLRTETETHDALTAIAECEIELSRLGAAVERLRHLRQSRELAADANRAAV